MLRGWAAVSEKLVSKIFISETFVHFFGTFNELYRISLDILFCRVSCNFFLFCLHKDTNENLFSSYQKPILNVPHSIVDRYEHNIN